MDIHELATIDSNDRWAISNNDVKVEGKLGLWEWLKSRTGLSEVLQNLHGKIVGIKAKNLDRATVSDLVLLEKQVKQRAGDYCTSKSWSVFTRSTVKVQHNSENILHTIADKLARYYFKNDYAELKVRLKLDLPAFMDQVHAAISGENPKAMADVEKTLHELNWSTERIAKWQLGLACEGNNGAVLAVLERQQGVWPEDVDAAKWEDALINATRNGIPQAAIALAGRQPTPELARRYYELAHEKVPVLAVGEIPRLYPTAVIALARLDRDTHPEEAVTRLLELAQRKDLTPNMRREVEQLTVSVMKQWESRDADHARRYYESAFERHADLLNKGSQQQVPQLHLLAIIALARLDIQKQPEAALESFQSLAQRKDLTPSMRKEIEESITLVLKDLIKDSLNKGQYNRAAFYCSPLLDLNPEALKTVKPGNRVLIHAMRATLQRDPAALAGGTARFEAAGWTKADILAAQNRVQTELRQAEDAELIDGAFDYVHTKALAYCDQGNETRAVECLKIIVDRVDLTYEQRDEVLSDLIGLLIKKPSEAALYASRLINRNPQTFRLLLTQLNSTDVSAIIYPIMLEILKEDRDTEALKKRMMEAGFQEQKIQQNLASVALARPDLYWEP